MPHPTESSARLSRYLPRPAIAWLDAEPDRRARVVEGTLVFADVSGFTALSERLAKQGRVGAEILADTISSCFTRLLAAAYSNGGSLLKFGGDALLLLFTGADHCRRGCHAAVGMRRELRSLGPIDGATGRQRLRMSVGVHTGSIDLFLVGQGHRELLVTGPAATEVVRMETIADKGEIVVSPAAARQLASGCLGAAKGDGFLLRRQPTAMFHTEPASIAEVPAEVIGRGLPAWLRKLAASGSDDPQHRLVTVAFLKFQGVNELLRERGTDYVAEVLDELVSDVQEAVEQHEVFLLGSDVDKDGGKLLLVAGAPHASGQDEDAMLCATRQIVEQQRAVRLRAGVNTGPAFAGDIGPAYRRTFTAMGDTVNLAARVMAHAEPGSVLATTRVLDRCRLPFAVTHVPPFLAKGKTLPIEAVEVGPAVAVTTRAPDAVNVLVGREAELRTIQSVWDATASGRGRVVVLVGEAGIGKSRLVAEMPRMTGTDPISVACAQYDVNTPYAAARQLLRGALGCGDDEDDRRVECRLQEVLHGADENLRRFAPLLGLVLRVNVPMTPEVADLDERFLRTRLEQTVAALLRLLLPGRCLLLVEDAHWIDDASAHLMDGVLMALRRQPWLLCVSRRAVLRGWQPALHAGDVEIALDPLDPVAATALAELLAMQHEHLDPRLIDDVVAKAGGNPLFVAELMAGLASSEGTELPDSLEGLIHSRIDSLAPEDAALLRRLSVMGANFSYDLAREALGSDVVPEPHNAVWRRLAEFVDLTQAKQIGFKHALLLDGAYNSLPFRIRENLHAQVGERLELEPGVAVGEHAELLSLHFFSARRHDKAWHYSRVAAGRARRVFANGEEARFLARAIEAARHGRCTSNDELLAAYEELGDVCGRMGELARATQAYQAGRRLAAGAVDQARLILKQARVRQLEGSFAQARRWLARADRLLESAGDPRALEQQPQLAVARASVAKDQNRPREVAKWCRLALEEAERIGDKPTQARAAFLLDHAYVRLGQPDPGGYSERALALYEEIGDLWGQGSVLNNMGGHAYWRGRWDEAVDLYTRSRAVFERIGDAGSEAAGLVNVGEIRSDQGRIDDAAQLFRRSLDIRQRMGDRASIAYVTSNMGRLATRSEMFEEAEQLLGNAREMAQALGLHADVLEADLRMVECLCHRGAVEDAIALAEHVAPRVPAHSLQAAMLERLLGYALLQQGLLTDARARFEVSRLEARAAQVPYEEGLTLRALAYHDSAVGVDPMPHLHAAERILTSLGVVAVDEPVHVSLTGSSAAIPEQSTAGDTDPVAS